MTGAGLDTAALRTEALRTELARLLAEYWKDEDRRAAVIGWATALRDTWGTALRAALPWLRQVAANVEQWQDRNPFAVPPAGSDRISELTRLAELLRRPPPPDPYDTLLAVARKENRKLTREEARAALLRIDPAISIPQSVALYKKLPKEYRLQGRPRKRRAF
jgi:hypothetical protein